MCSLVSFCVYTAPFSKAIGEGRELAPHLGQWTGKALQTALEGLRKTTNKPQSKYQVSWLRSKPSTSEYKSIALFLCQLVNTATSSPADDVHHYVIPQSYYRPTDSIFNKLSVFMHQWEKEKAVLYPVEVLPP
jgi:hypothetical protein